MRPSQVVDLQAEMIDRTRDQRYRRYAAAFFFMDQYRKEHSGWQHNAYAARSEQELRQISSAFAYRLHEVLPMTEAYWVSTEMVRLVTFANESIEDAARFESDTLPSPYGLVYLDEQLTFQELYGRKMSLRVLVWAPIVVNSQHKSTLFLGFTDAHDLDDITKELIALNRQVEVTDLMHETELNDAELDRIVQQLGRYQLSVMDVWVDGQRVGPKLVPVPEDRMNERADVNGEPATYPWSFNLLRWMVTYWTMMNQTVVASSREPLERLTARRVRRYKIPEHVTVVQLRRRESNQKHVGETSVEWQHRWMVRGHWRNQPYGEGRRDVRRIWIHPFVKGPADKPLVQTQKVYALTR